MPDPFVVDVGAGQTFTAATSVTVTLPTHAIGDILVVILGKTNSAAVTNPSGWFNLRSQQASGTVLSQSSHYRVATQAGTPAPVFTFASSTGVAQVLVIRDADPVVPFASSGTGATSGTSFGWGTLAAPDAPRMLHVFTIDRLTGNSGGSSLTAPGSGYTEHYETHNGTAIHTWAASELQTAAGAVGASNATGTNSVRWVAQSFLFRSKNYPIFRSGAGIASAASTTVSVPLPAGTVADDAQFAHLRVVSPTVTVTPAAGVGWAEVGSAVTNQAGTERLHTWARRVPASPAATVFTFSSSVTRTGLSVTYRNAVASPGALLAAGESTASGSASPVSVAGFAPDHTNTTLLLWAIGNPTTVTYTAGTGQTERMDNLASWLGDEAWETTDATGAQTATISAAANWAARLIALKSPVSAAGGVARTVTGTQPAAAGDLTRQKAALRALAGAQPAASAVLTRQKAAPRALAGLQPAAAAVLTRIKTAPRTLSGAQPPASGTLTAVLAAAASRARVSWLVLEVPALVGAASRLLVGVQPAASAVLTRIKAAARALTGVQPAASAVLVRVKEAVRVLAGAQPAATGALVRSKANVRALSGAQPAATGTLASQFGDTLLSINAVDMTRRGELPEFLQSAADPLGLDRWRRREPAAGLSGLPTPSRTLTGAQPAASGALSAQVSVSRSLAGAQPASSGALTRLTQALRALVGNQPTATGVLTKAYAGARALLGAQPPAGGELTRLASTSKALVGVQPPADGQLSRRAQVTRSLSGAQPAPAGALTYFVGETDVPGHLTLGETLVAEALLGDALSGGVGVGVGEVGGGVRVGTPS